MHWLKRGVEVVEGREGVAPDRAVDVDCVLFDNVTRRVDRFDIDAIRSLRRDEQFAVSDAHRIGHVTDVDLPFDRVTVAERIHDAVGL